MVDTMGYTALHVGFQFQGATETGYLGKSAYGQALNFHLKVKSNIGIL